MRKKIIIKTSFRGTHNWPEAGQIAGPEVSFLQNDHRHTFYVKVELSVSKSDREFEFFVLQKMVDNTINFLYEKNEDDFVIQLGRRSCETVAEEIIKQLRYILVNKELSVEVWEDDEVGARVEDIWLAHAISE